MTSERESDARIATALVRTWDPFFGRFGRLTPTQRAAIPLILQGEDVLLAAPTATGKTEAVCAPLVEQRMSRGIDWKVLYVSPTRALVNDLYERLNPALTELRIRALRRTGDHHDTIPAGPAVIITTPESFDSLLCRGKTTAESDIRGHLLANVTGVALDEIHLLHGTPRGTQLRWLLERLRRLRSFAKRSGWTRSDRLQVVGLSATVSDARDVLDAYLPGGALAELHGGRPIETIEVNAPSPATDEVLPVYTALPEAAEKILVFSNARKRVDHLAASLRPPLSLFGYSVLAHHGSLSQDVREDAEAAIKRDRKVVLFATSTLEIGIDIGDIDLVVLDSPAPDVSALLQRVGRGNRRTGTTRVITCSGSLAETIIHAAMLEAARHGELGDSHYGPQFAVARQQLASYIFQSPRGRHTRDRLEDLVRSVEPTIPADRLVSHLIATADLREDGSGVRLGEDWLEATRRGEIHSNIESNAGIAVQDQRTGKQIALGVKSQEGKGLKVGGKLLQVRKWEAYRLQVESVSREADAQGEWSYVSRAWVTGPGQPQAVRKYLGVEPDTWPMITVGSETFVFHFGGARRKAVIELALGGVHPEVSRVSPWFLVLAGLGGERPDDLAELSYRALSVELSDPDRVEKLEKTLARPYANARLPDEIRSAEVSRWLDLEREVQDINASRWLVASTDVEGALRVIAQDIRR